MPVSVVTLRFQGQDHAAERLEAIARRVRAPRNHAWVRVLERKMRSAIGRMPLASAREGGFLVLIFGCVSEPEGWVNIVLGRINLRMQENVRLLGDELSGRSFGQLMEKANDENLEGDVDIETKNGTLCFIAEIGEVLTAVTWVPFKSGGGTSHADPPCQASLSSWQR